MTLAGWTLAQIATVFGIGAMGITGLYLLKMRRREVVVPFAALWERVTRESETRRLWRKLRRLLSWIIQLAVLAALCFALGDPRPSSWLRDPVTLAVVVDRSASMAGPSDSEPGSRLDAAMARVRAALEALGPADRVVVIAAGAEVDVSAPLGVGPEARANLVPPTPQPGEADLTGALALARNAVAGQPGPKILIITDGALDEAGLFATQTCMASTIPCVLHRVTGPPDNLAITAFAARRYPHDREHVEVLTEFANLGDTAVSVVLEVTADGVSVGQRQLTLEPGTQARQILPDLDAARARFVAKLRSPQGRPLAGPLSDDEAYAVVPPLRPYEVTLVTDGTDLFLEAALLTLDDHVRLRGIGPDDAVAGHPSLERADLVILDVADGPVPSPLPDAHLMVFDPWRRPDRAFPLELAREVRRPILTEQDRKHPIVSHIVLKDTNLARGTTFETEPGDQVLVRTLGEPIVVLRERDRGILALGFDPRQTDLPLRVAFPLLVANAVTYFERLQAGFVASVPVGSTRELSLSELGLVDEGVTRIQVTAPSGAQTTVPVDRGRVRLRALEPGFMTLEAVDGSLPGTQVDLAVNQANVAASDLRDRTDQLDLQADAMAGPPPGAAPVADDPIWMTLLLLVAGIVAVEWFSYHRRVTV